jgi:L-alanine-DL-glutamate epimerase-like enolase superfamily enzyme
MDRFEVTWRRLVLRAPMRTSWGEMREREVAHVRLDWGGGDFGEGEAAPLEPYDRVSPAAVAAALQVYESVLRDADPGAGHADLLAACAAARDLPQALAAIDLALWDRAGRRSGRPVAQLLARSAPAAVIVNATIGAEDRAEAAAQAAAAARAGFGCVKVKVGIGDDAGRVAAVRAAVGPQLAIRVDANGAWSNAHESLANLRALAPAGLEYAEEPVNGLDALRAVRAASPVRIAMDESADEPGAAGSGATDAVCLKISRCGGITGLLRDAAAARAAGSAVYVASTFDGPLGVAAGLHAAAALATTGPVAPCGLATLGLFEGFDGVLAPHGGEIAVPAGPGLIEGGGRRGAL